MNRNVEMPDTFRGSVWLIALLYCAFVVYGSLVPFDFHALPWDQAIEHFSAIPYLHLDVGSRADWVANLILYIPVGYLLMGVWVGRNQSALAQAVGALLSGLMVAALAVSIEFAQQFFPPRTVSLNDLYAEWAGGALGMLLWPLAGRPLSGLWRRFAQGGPRAVRAALKGYVLVYLFLSFFPYDFLVAADEWHARLSPDKAGWIFAGSCGLACWIKLVPEVLAAVPFGLLWASRPGRLSLFAAAGFGVLLGLTVEILQLCIASGISQGASVFSRAVGVALGAALPSLFANWDSRRMRPRVRGGLLLAAVPYAGGLAWLNHWFGASWANSQAAMTRLGDIHFLPFYYHYYTSEAVALTSLVFQFGLYAPLGAGVWLWNAGTWRRSRAGGLAALMGMLVAFVVETGKLFVPGQHPDPTNVLIAATAAGMGHALLTRLFPKGQSQPVQLSGGQAPVSEPAELPEPAKAKTRTASPARLTALGLLVAAALSVLGYPLGWLPLILLLALASVCWRWPGSWLIVIPAALPLLDFSYLSGRLFWSEFDTLLLLILAIAYSRERDTTAVIWPGRLPLALYVASASISLISGLTPLAPLDFNAFAHYTSPYHALHAVKGLAFALAFLPLIKTEWNRNSGQFTARLAWGMSLGLALEALYVLWERATFPGLWNFDTDFRITGSFPGMHIGGASIEAYLVLSAPFVWLWAWPRQRIWAMLLAGSLYVLAAYGVMVTFSRGGQAAFAVATLLILAGYARLNGKTRKWGMAGIPALLVAVAAAGGVAWPVISGTFSQSRLATIKADTGTRAAHWEDAFEILSQAGNRVLGAGAGAFPAAFYWYSSAPTRPATYAFMKQGSNVFLRLGGGETLYFEQVVPVEPGRTYRLLLDVRTSAKSATLAVPVCEKALLYSFTCAWNTLNFSGDDGQWKQREIRVRTDRFSSPGSLFQRPIKLSMFNRDRHVLIDVDNVALFDETGRNLVRNGNFSRGMEGWFFSTDSHLAWHAKNLFVHVLFEQGLLGLGALLALLAVAGLTLLKRVGHDALALTLFVSLTAFLIVGLVDSLIDEPRLDFLFFWLLGVALLSGGKALRHRRRSGAGRSRAGETMNL